VIAVQAYTDEWFYAPWGLSISLCWYVDPFLVTLVTKTGFATFMMHSLVAGIRAIERAWQ
jgi:hypothetical protein